MVAPLIGAALVGGAAQLLGGAIGQRHASREAARARAATDPATIRRKAEAAGFNPLLFTGSAFSTAGTVAPPVFGQAVANAGLTFMNGMQKQIALEVQQSHLETENQRLDRLVTDLTLTPQPIRSSNAYTHVPARPVPAVNHSPDDGQLDPAIGTIDPSQVETGRNTVTNPAPTDSGRFVDPTRQDAEVAEARYGDTAQEVAGLINNLSDLRYNRELRRAAAYSPAHSPADFHARVLRDPSYREQLRVNPFPDLSPPPTTMRTLDRFINRRVEPPVPTIRDENNMAYYLGPDGQRVYLD